MIWFHPPLSPSSVSKLDQRHTGRRRKRDNLLTGKGGEKGNHTTARKLGPLEIIWYSLYNQLMLTKVLLSGDLPRAGHLQPKAARVFAQGQSKAGPSLPGIYNLEDDILHASRQFLQIKQCWEFINNLWGPGTE